jgi:hypothetical protein
VVTESVVTESVSSNRNCSFERLISVQGVTLGDFGQGQRTQRAQQIRTCITTLASSQCLSPSKLATWLPHRI